MKMYCVRYLSILAIMLLTATLGLAKGYEFCGGKNYSYGDRESFKELREKTVQPYSTMKVESRNGRITVKGENRGDVMVRACVKAYAETEAEAQTIVKGISVETAPFIRAENTPRENWSVSYEILVPNRTNLELMSRNGRLTISNVQGDMNFETYNGRITLENVDGNIKGKTRNGRVTVKLTNTAMIGNGIDVETSNGRVTLYLPETYPANIEARTNNGRFSSDFTELNSTFTDRRSMRGSGTKKVNASINGGGSPIRLVTNNGRVSILSLNKKGQ